MVHSIRTEVDDLNIHEELEEKKVLLLNQVAGERKNKVFFRDNSAKSQSKSISTSDGLLPEIKATTMSQTFSTLKSITKEKTRLTTFRSMWQQQKWYPFVCERFFHPLLVDPRNDCFVLFTLLMLSTVFVSAIFLLFVNFTWIGAIFHIYLVLTYAGSFTAILHNTSHKKMYRKEFDFLNYIVPVVLCPVFGQTWNTYYYHHVKHHHVQDNGPEDLSSTLRFQRDSFIDFCQYFLRFLFLVAIELPIYFIKRGQYWNAFFTIGGEVASLTMDVIFLQYNFFAAMTVFIIPLLIVRFGMMSGNWGQHAFVDQDDPKCNYKSSTICIHHEYNVQAFNDGYHTSHHLNPRRHWSELPTHLVDELDVYYENRPIVFTDLDFMGVWILLMTKNYTKLAKQFVHIGPESERPTEAQIKALLKSRVQRFSEQQIRRCYSTPTPIPEDEDS